MRVFKKNCIYPTACFVHYMRGENLNINLHNLNIKTSKLPHNKEIYKL